MPLNLNYTATIVPKTAAEWAADTDNYTAKRILMVTDDFYTGTSFPKLYFRITTGPFSSALLFPVSSATTLYTGNGSLTGDRIVNGAGYMLTFDNMEQVRVVTQTLPADGFAEVEFKGVSNINVYWLSRWVNGSNNTVMYLTGSGRLGVEELYTNNVIYAPLWKSPFFPSTEINMGSTIITMTTGLNIGGPLRTPYREISADYSLTNFDSYIRITANDPDILLLSASIMGAGFEFTFKNSRSNTLAARIVAAGAELIEGMTTKYVFPGESCQLVSTASGWDIKGESKAYNYYEVVSYTADYQSARLIGAVGITFLILNGVIITPDSFTLDSSTGTTDIPVEPDDKLSVLFS